MTDDDREAVDETTPDPDADSSAEKLYECNECGYRMTAAHQPERCPRCGGDMIDLSVSRE